MKFEEIGLSPEIKKAVDEMGFTELTPIQEKTYDRIRAGRNLMALAETGSGKTSACGIPISEMIDTAIPGIQALILVPTRELALQYVDELSLIGKYAGIAPFAIYGGFSMGIQKAKLEDGVHVLVATPGRLIDHLYRSTLTLEEVRTVVLDEADEMLKMGFIEDVRFILSCLMNVRQTLFFSATMAGDIEDLANTFLHDPVRIELNREDVSPQSIIHRFRFVSGRNRLEVLKRYFNKEKPAQAIIFCNSKRNGAKLYSRLKRPLKSMEYIHGGLDQNTRTAIFSRFKQGKTKVLIATDVAGRGLDFSQVSHIFNYDFPREPENYVHRTGRTGRMGREGKAISLVTGRDLFAVKSLFRKKGIKGVWDGKVPDLQRAAVKRDRKAPPGRSKKNVRPGKKTSAGRMPVRDGHLQ